MAILGGARIVDLFKSVLEAAQGFAIQGAAGTARGFGDTFTVLFRKCVEFAEKLLGVFWRAVSKVVWCFGGLDRSRHGGALSLW